MERRKRGEELFVCLVSFLLLLFDGWEEFIQELKADVSVKESISLSSVPWASADN